MRFVPNLMGFEPLKLSNLSFLSKQKCRVDFLGTVSFGDLNSLKMKKFGTLNFSDLAYRF